MNPRQQRPLPLRASIFLDRFPGLQHRKSLMPAQRHKLRIEAFYATLSSEQKTKLDSREGRSRFWRWLERV